MAEEAEQDDYVTRLKMLAVQIVAQLPANKEEADFVLAHVDLILEEVIYRPRVDRPPITAN